MEKYFNNFQKFPNYIKVTYIKKHLYCSEYWIIGSNPRQNREGTTKFFANTLKIFTRTLWSFRNDPWTSEQPRFPKSSSSKHPDTVAGNGAAQVSHCAILSPDVCVRCFPEPGLCDTKVRSAPGFSLRLWKKGKERENRRLLRTSSCSRSFRMDSVTCACSLIVET